MASDETSKPHFPRAERGSFADDVDEPAVQEGRRLLAAQVCEETPIYCIRQVFLIIWSS